MKSKYILITGATGGLGSALTLRLWDEGFSLVLLSRDEGKLGALKESLEARDEQKCFIYKCDLADSKSVKDFCSKICSATYSIFGIINNAAIHGPIGKVTEQSILEWPQAMQVNLLSPAFISVAISKKMSCEGGGVIINISGGGATSPRPNFSCYSTTKAALVRFSETLAEELKDDNVRVNCISPGPMATPLLGEIINIGEERSGSKEFYDAKKIFQSQKLDMGKVTDLVLFLLSNASKGINGKIISAVWDNWREWPLDLEGLSNSDVFTLRRVIGKDRGMNWCDNE